MIEDLAFVNRVIGLIKSLGCYKVAGPDSRFLGWRSGGEGERMKKNPLASFVLEKQL